VATDLKAKTAPAPPPPATHEQDASWVAKLSEKNRLQYYQARVAFASAEDAHADALAKARAVRDKPQQDLDSAKALYEAARGVKTQAMAEMVKKKKAIEQALEKLDPAKADDKAESDQRVAEVQKALDDYSKVGLTGVATATAGVATADANVRKLAEDTGDPPEKLHLDPEAKDISDKQYDLAQATAADPLDNAKKAFYAARAKIYATLP
jgi:hypothetical protein